MNIEKLKKQWLQLCDDENMVHHKALLAWTKIEEHYTQDGRAYHNFQHLDNMFEILKEYESEVEDLSTLRFTIWYHDIIYKATKRDNELKSAELAKTELIKLNFRITRMERCYQQILSTQKHVPAADASFDEKLILDLDLEVLSWDWERYLEYTQQIREEYSIYPDFLYRRGRRDAMTKFAERQDIFYTPKFKLEKEPIARENLRKEIELLTL